MTGNGGGFWRSVRRLPDRTPLRVKLITAVLALVAVALAVISIAGITFLRSYLLGQADNQLATLAGNSQRPVADFLGGLNSGQAQTRSALQQMIDWIPSGGSPHQVIQPVTNYNPYTGSGQVQPGPVIQPHAGWLSGNGTAIVPAVSGGGRWLVEAIPVLGAPGNQSTSGTIVVGVDLSGTYRTIGRLASIDVIVSAIVLLGLAVVGVAVVRASLRPLTDIEKTTEAIAAGDLTRRVPDRDPRTEVGRLARSLNTMLAQIETAFRSQARSETAARRSEERMRQFVTDASHELRTPLTAIRGFAEYYRQRGGISSCAAVPEAAGTGPGSPAPASPGGNGYGQLQRADLDRIMRRVEQESSRMGVLVEDMLLLARLDQQRPLECSTVDLLTLAADAVHDARVVAPDRSINLTVGAGSALLVLGDEVRLRQVIGNLMSNALSHTPDGTPIDVTIRSGSLAEADGHGVYRPADPGQARGPAATPGASAALAAPEGPEVPAASPATPASSRSAAVIEVADHGHGLTPEQAGHVFERFYRADQARTVGGTGLGLAIVASLVAAHGGAVWVQSPPGGGAIFRIALPLAPEALADDPEPEDADDADLPADPDMAAGSYDGPGFDQTQNEPDILDSPAHGGRRPTG